MKKCSLIFLLFTSVLALAQDAVPSLSMKADTDFFQLPEGYNFGEVTGVATNSAGAPVRLSPRPAPLTRI